MPENFWTIFKDVNLHWEQGPLEGWAVGSLCREIEGAIQAKRKTFDWTLSEILDDQTKRVPLPS